MFAAADNNIEAQGVQLLAQVLLQLPNLTHLDLQGETSHPSTFISTLCVRQSKKKRKRKKNKKGGKGKGGKREETQNEGNGNVEYLCVSRLLCGKPFLLLISVFSVYFDF